jgi:hypothetical protein
MEGAKVGGCGCSNEPTAIHKGGRETGSFSGRTSVWKEQEAGENYILRSLFGSNRRLEKIA